MFTGLIEAVGRVADITAGAGGTRIRIEASIAPELAVGESIAVDGVCLTATVIDGTTFAADIGPETARVTTLGALRTGQVVNLERAMRSDARFGGHLVQGHVDATGTLVRVREDGDAHWLTVRFPGAVAPYLVPKGSVAVNGVSLTVARLAESTFDLMIIPFTWEHTNLSTLSEGAAVNIEGDMVGKYVARAVEVFRSA
jgi:riboflavin synthase